MRQKKSDKESRAQYSIGTRPEAASEGMGERKGRKEREVAMKKMMVALGCVLDFERMAWYHVAHENTDDTCRNWPRGALGACGGR